MLDYVLANGLKDPQNTDLFEVLQHAINMKNHNMNGPSYQSFRKLYAKCMLWNSKDTDAAYSLVESIAPTLRTMAMFRYEQRPGDQLSTMQQCTDQINMISESSQLGLLSKSKNLNKLLNKFANLNVNNVKKCPKATLNKENLTINCDDAEDLKKFVQKVRQLPEEWTIVQLTAAYNPTESWEDRKTLNKSVVAFHLTVLRNEYVDCDKVFPITVTVSPNNLEDVEKPLFEELHSLLEENIQVIGNSMQYSADKNLKQYWSKRESADGRIKKLINAMQTEWLSGWKCLLVGRIADDSLKQSMEKLVDESCKECCLVGLSNKQHSLLNILMLTTHHLTGAEVRATLKQIFIEFLDIDTTRDKDKLAKVLAETNCPQCVTERSKANFRLCLECRKIYFSKFVTSDAKSDLYSCIIVFSSLASKIKNDPELETLQKAKRGPVILVIDEYLDTFPWESLSILKNEPVTRMENFHFLYALYEKHKHNIVRGHYQLKPFNCTFLINPSNDLDRMEKRMSSFMSYWYPEWKGQKNKPPPPDSCMDYITKSNIFLYCGHGDGCQYVSNSISEIEGSNDITSSVLLYGCSSVKLVPPGGRVLATAAHHTYHIAGCPSVAGMLWEVTDLEVDKIATMLLSLFVPSKVQPHWGNVKKKGWCEGKIDGTLDNQLKFDLEPNLLRAISKSRKFSKFLMISSSIVARGLPIEIDPEYQLP